MIGFRIVGPGNVSATVTRSPSEPGWRVTYFDGDEPIGHSTRATVLEALHLALERGNTIAECRGDGADEVARVVESYIADLDAWLDLILSCEDGALGDVLDLEPQRPW